MKKIIGLVLALVLLTSVFAVLPTMAADEATITDVAVRLDQGITLVYKLSNGGYEYVPVAAKEMNKVAGPEGYTDGITSVKGYATDLLAKTDDELTVALVNAMLNYGAAAQNYFKYETDNLVGKPVTDTTALNELEVSAPVVNDGEGIYLGATLVLEGTLTLRFYFTGNDRVIECENNTPAVTNKGDVCYVDIPFMPYDIAEPITVTTGETSVTYAPINYLKAMASSDIENIPQMVASIYAYSVAARAYYIEYNCEHRGIILNTVVVPTIFTEGLAQGACPLCGDVISEKLENTKAEMNAFTSTDNEKDWFYKSVSVGDILGENNLYGDDGVDIFVEFSILLNETMDMFANDNFTLPGVWLNESLTGTKHGDGFYYLYLTQGGMPKGAFEMWNSRCNKVENGYIYGETCNGKGDDLYVGNFDGWHRIGVQMHFEAFVENGEPYYINTVSLYIDGVMVHKYMMRTDDDDKENNSVLTAIEAIVENDQIVGYKNRTDRYINVFRYTPNLKEDYAGETGYFPVADCYVTAGNGFVVTVTPVTNPEAQDFIQDGIPLSGKQYFAVKDLSDCYAGNHNYSDIATVDTPATCTTDGQKSIKCTVCGETQEGSVVVIPAAHTWGASTVDTHATCTTDGQKSIKCTVCSETKEGSIEVIPAAHTWAENATLDVAATCTTNGSASIKCTVCKATKPDSTVTIPATGHNGIEITVVPTLFSEGYEKGTCTVCGETKDGALAKTKATMNTMTTSHNASNVVKEEIPFSTILGDDKHFYEHDLLIEFSLLMNDYMKYIGGETNVANISFPGVNGESAHWLFLENGGDAPKGQFDYWNSNAKEKILDTPIQLNFDGWYRFGVRYHQNTYRNGDTFTYDVTVSLYINGVKVHEFIQKTGNNKFLLYTAEVIDGEVVYTDLVDRSALIYSMGNAYARGVTAAYLPIADVYATCGDDFVIDVEPMNKPLAETFEQDNVKLSGIRYYKLKGEIEEHVHEGITVTTVPTLFSEGRLQGTCTLCGEVIDEPVAKTKATMNTMTTSHTASNVVKEEIPFSTILGDDKHFYEHDLLIEFSLLMNDYMKYIGETNVANISFPGVNGESAHWLFLENGGDAPKGQFDYWNSNAKEKILDTPIQLNFDGWYRFGVRYHQNTYRNGDTFTYDVTVSLYINGVKVHEFIQKTGNNKFLLYTAEVIDGEVVYTDLVDRSALIYSMGNAYARGGTAYLPIADVYATCGDDFVIDVEPMNKPLAETFEQDNVKLSGIRYYKLKGEIEEHVHEGLTVTTVPTVFSTGYLEGTCTVCGKHIEDTLPMTNAEVIKVTNTSKNDLIINKYESFENILEGGKTFHPTTDNPEGNSLYIEFSMLLDSSMENFKPTNITFPGIYYNSYIDPAYGESAFWFFILKDYMQKGQYDDWTSNTIPGEPYYNTSPTLKFDGWHRFQIEFHQNTDIDYENETITYSMTVIMHIDGVKVYEAVLGDTAEYPDRNEKFRLYDAKFVDGEVVYTDNTDYYAVFYSYNAYVKSGTTANFITADMYATCGDGFVIDVEEADNPVVSDFTQDGVTIKDAKQYFVVVNDTNN